MSSGRLLSVVGAALLLTGCSRAPTTERLAQDAASVMGGADRLRGVQSLVMRGGAGTRLKLGQTVRATDVEKPATLKNVVETLDLANGRAALDYELENQGFMQHRQEVLTKKGDRAVGLENVAGRPLAVMSPSGLFSWGSQNSPEFLLRRNVITVMLAALDSSSGQAAEDRQFGGKTQKFGTAMLRSGESVGLYFDPESKLLSAYETTDTETMLGDVPAQYVLADYRDVNGVKLPHKITIQKGGQPYSEVQFTSAAINDAGALAVFAIPEAANAEVDRAIAAGDYSPITLQKVSDGVTFARAYSHNSMVVEFPTFLTVVEGAYTDAQSQTLARVLAEQYPGKPIRYVAVTHHHFDHTGGVRGLAAHGATVLVEKGHEAALRPIVESPHTNPPDSLETARKSGKAGGLEVYEGKKVISEGGQTLELYAITGNPHVDPKVIAFAPAAGALFQSDLFFPGTGAPASPAAVHLLQSVRALKLPVKVNVGGHGGVAPFDELVKAVAAVPATSTN
jgi:glyoxylase-like metal-dependent hydrolase (beta-lactamase superfamily II)